jgi:hypothetical protein
LHENVDMRPVAWHTLVCACVLFGISASDLAQDAIPKIV